jgi:hypothetical protein
METTIKTVPPRPRGRGLLGFLVGLILGIGVLLGWRATLPPVQNRYLREYAANTLKATIDLSSLHSGAKPNRAKFMRDWYRLSIYGGQSIFEFVRVPLGMTGFLAVLLAILGSRVDAKMMRELREGRVLAGPDLDTRSTFNARMRESGELPGVGLLLRNPRTFRERLRGIEGRVLRLPLQSETQHFTVGGATGAGKTLLITQILDQVQDRANTDAAIIWDPTGVLMRRYFNPERGDIVLNPLDARCPSWNPAWELKGMSQAMAEAAAQAMGTSLYVGRATASDSDRFFTDAAIALWKHIVVNSSPTEAQELAYWMANATPELDLRVRGTKLEQDLDPGSTPQRNGIISTFTKVEHALSAIPLSEDAPRWTVKDWCADRKGWLFLTTTADTKESLRPIQSLWLDMLIRQLMTQGERPDLRAPWFFFDELAALQRLPTLESGLSEGRKFNLRFVLGFQAMSQVEALYSKEGAQTLLAMPKTQVLLRTGEAMAAEWMSKQCGDQRIEELKESYPASWSGGNGNRTVSTEIKDRRLFIPSEFMGLKDLRGILRHGNSLVRIEIPYMARVQRADAFVPRLSKPMPGPKPEPEMDPPQTVEPDSAEILEAVPAGRGASEGESQIEY